MARLAGRDAHEDLAGLDALEPAMGTLARDGVGDVAALDQRNDAGSLAGGSGRRNALRVRNCCA